MPKSLSSYGRQVVTEQRTKLLQEGAKTEEGAARRAEKPAALPKEDKPS